VAFSEDKAGTHTTLEISTADRPGLLARLGSVLSEHQVSIQGAKIQTLGERVEDVFFLTDAGGGPLRDDASLARIEQQLIAVLDASQSDSRAPSEIAI
jgi:[protein-PII] uridylyltransferase